MNSIDFKRLWSIVIVIIADLASEGTLYEAPGTRLHSRGCRFVASSWRVDSGRGALTARRGGQLDYRHHYDEALVSLCRTARL